jgi:hypothetical protein
MTGGDPSSPIDPENDSTGLPGLRTWPKIYLLVVGLFFVWVGLMFTLERIFS